MLLSVVALLMCSALAQNEGFHRVVFVMRHCVRSTKTAFPPGDEPYPSYSNYSATPFPEWPIPAMLCLPRGLEIINGQGQNFQGQFPGPVYVISDNIQRDINTSIALVAGLGLTNEIQIQVDGSIFDPITYGICPEPSEEFWNSALQYRWNEFPVPANHTAMMTYLQSKLGQGAAPLIQNIRDSVFDEKLNGGSYVGYEFAEFLEMQYAGGYDISWSGISPEDTYTLTALISYARGVMDRAFPTVQYTQSNVLAHILSALDDNTTSTTFFVGHDTTIDAMATFFDLQWNDEPYAQNFTPPGAALRFDLWSLPDQEPTITATYWYTTFENTLGNMTVVNATFGVDGTNQMGYAQFKTWAEDMLYMPCVNVSSVPAM
jgi:hypothetical protein